MPCRHGHSHTGSCRSPLRDRVLVAQWLLELYGGPAALSEQPPPLACVVVHQLGQRGEPLPSVEIIVVARVLDIDVGHLTVAPGRQVP